MSFYCMIAYICMQMNANKWKIRQKIMHTCLNDVQIYALWTIKQTIRKSKVRPRKSIKTKTSLLQWIKHRKKSMCVCARSTLSQSRYLCLSLFCTHTLLHMQRQKKDTHTHTQADKQAQKERKKERLVSQVAHARALLRLSSLGQSKEKKKISCS